ncbi:hypothetical protein D9615_006023 [Tricholomella constricta]|uniref:Uncharacterized protein n=1 Tax=Tricholomella constricta TaxID=117010 RepID=A0A8H5M3B9_9AGAR|nr:hypothetical protein D9615_006023 [Tricholomella constricta]
MSPPPKADDPRSNRLSPTDATHPSIPVAYLRIAFNGTKLHKDKVDFKKWERSFRAYIAMNQLTGYLYNPLILTPLPHEEPRAYANFKANGALAIAALHGAVDDSLAEYIDYDKSADKNYEALKAHCLSAGPIKQVATIRKALSTYCSTSTPITDTAKEICELVDAAFDMGEINRDLFKCIAILNSLNDQAFESTQSTISRALSESTKEKPYTLANIQGS